MSETITKRMAAVRILSRSTHAGTKSVRMFYQLFAESVLTYGLPTYWHGLGAKEKAALNSVQLEG
eukprot:GSA120T00012210001.1